MLRPYQEITDSLYKDRELIENQGENSTEKEAEAVANATADETAYSTLPAKEQAPTPPVPAAPPAPEKRIYGDGGLQKLVRQFARDNPDKYPTDMYTEFLGHFTQIVQNSKNPDEIGLEEWRAQRRWNTANRLEKWHVGYLEDHKPNEQSSRNSKNGHNGAGTSSRPKTSNSRPSKRTPYITPDKLRRDGPATGDKGSGSDGRTIILNVE